MKFFWSNFNKKWFIITNYDSQPPPLIISHIFIIFSLTDRDLTHFLGNVGWALCAQAASCRLSSEIDHHAARPSRRLFNTEQARKQARWYTGIPARHKIVVFLMMLLCLLFQGLHRCFATLSRSNCFKSSIIEQASPPMIHTRYKIEIYLLL